MSTSECSTVQEQTILSMAQEIRDRLGELRIKLDGSFGSKPDSAQGEGKPILTNVLDEIFEVQSDSREIVSGINHIVEVIIRKIH